MKIKRFTVRTELLRRLSERKLASVLAYQIKRIRFRRIYWCISGDYALGIMFTGNPCAPKLVTVKRRPRPASLISALYSELGERSAYEYNRESAAQISGRAPSMAIVTTAQRRMTACLKHIQRRYNMGLCTILASTINI